MVVEAVTTFLDLETGDLREQGERFEVTEGRCKAINGTKYGELVREVEQPRPRRTRKAKEQ